MDAGVRSFIQSLTRGPALVPCGPRDHLLPFAPAVHLPLSSRVTNPTDFLADRVTLAYFNTDTVASIIDNAYPSLTSTYGYDASDRLAAVARSGPRPNTRHLS